MHKNKVVWALIGWLLAILVPPQRVFGYVTGKM